MSFVVRPTTGADLAAVDALLAHSYPRLLKADYPPSVLVTALPLISRAQPALMSCGTYYLAERPDGQVIGAGGWTRDRGRADKGHIRHVVTDSDSVRQGVGRAILAHALRAARAAGIGEMECWSTRTAQPFYAALGFVDEGPIDVTLQRGISFPAILMRQSLR